MQELSITINNSVLPSICSRGEESETSVYSANEENDRQRPRPDAYDPLSVSDGILTELYQEPSSIERPQSRSQPSVACSARAYVCAFVCLWSHVSTFLIMPSAPEPHSFFFLIVPSFITFVLRV
jgi:hypothetical protein